MILSNAGLFSLIVLALAWLPVGISIGRDSFCTEVSIRVPLNRKIWVDAAKWWNKLKIISYIRECQRSRYWKFAIWLEILKPIMWPLILKIYLCWLRKTLQTILNNVVFLSYGNFSCSNNIQCTLYHTFYNCNDRCNLLYIHIYLRGLLE